MFATAQREQVELLMLKINELVCFLQKFEASTKHRMHEMSGKLDTLEHQARLCPPPRLLSVLLLPRLLLLLVPTILIETGRSYLTCMHDECGVPAGLV